MQEQRQRQEVEAGDRRQETGDRGRRQRQETGDRDRRQECRNTGVSAAFAFACAIGTSRHNIVWQRERAVSARAGLSRVVFDLGRGSEEPRRRLSQ